jgi:transposase InsO family protein
LSSWPKPFWILFIKPGSPWENGYVENSNGKLRDELLNEEIFTTLQEAKVLMEVWRRKYNEAHPHSSLGYKPPAPCQTPANDCAWMRSRAIPLSLLGTMK